jgi:hypothetical protein
MGVSQGLKFRIYGFMDKLFGTVLNTSETVHTLIINGIDHLTGVQIPIIINTVHTLFLYADRTFQASLFPSYNA